MISNANYPNLKKPLPLDKMPNMYRYIRNIETNRDTLISYI